MPQRTQPNSILQSTFIGIIRIYQKYKQKVPAHIYSQKYSYISKEIKELLIRILNEVHHYLMTKQNITNSMYNHSFNNNNIQYPPSTNSSIPSFYQENNQSHSAEQLKKYIQSNKLLSFYMLNQMNNPTSHSLHNYLSNSMNSLNLSNPYLGMGTTPNTMLNLHHLNALKNSSNISNLNINNLPNGMPNGLSNGLPHGLPNGLSNGLPNGLSNGLVNGLPNVNKNFPYGMYSNSLIPSQFMGPYSSLNMLNNLNSNQAYNNYSFQKQENLLKSNNLHQNSNHSNHLGNQALNKKNLNQNFQKKNQKVNQKNFNNKTYENKKQKQKNNLNHKNHKAYESTSKIDNTPIINLSNKDQNKNPTPQIKKKQHISIYKDLKKLQIKNQQFKFCACQGFYQFDKSFKCKLCQNNFHYKCLSIIIYKQQIQAQNTECPHCRMKFMDPLNKVQKSLVQIYLLDILEKPIEINLNYKCFENYYKEKNSKYQIQIRCIRSGEHMENLQMTWPDQFIVKMKGQKIFDIPALQTNSSLKKRKDYPISITQQIIISSSNFIHQSVNLTLQIKNLTKEQQNQRKIKNQYLFAFGIYIVQKLNADELFAKVMDSQRIIDKNFLKKIMNSPQNQIQINKITIKLLDPYSWQLIKIPVRGSNCAHIQCFDLKNFICLMHSARNRTWRCPLCSKDARKFILDEQQLDILQKAQQINPTPKQVLIYKEGQIAFKVQKQSDDQEQKPVTMNKTKKIFKQKKEQIIKQK